MLTIKVEAQEFYDAEKNMFFTTKPMTVRMEHSLISISKWEARWEKPYLPVPGRTDGMNGNAEEISYLRCMIIGKVPPHIPTVLYNNYSTTITNYIDKKHTATTIHRMGGPRPSKQVITTELIYYWMLKFGIPFECQTWHFNRLLTLIDVCSVKESQNSKKGKMNHFSSAKYRHQLNKARQMGGV